MTLRAFLLAYTSSAVTTVGVAPGPRISRGGKRTKPTVIPGERSPGLFGGGALKLRTGSQEQAR